MKMIWIILECHTDTKNVRYQKIDDHHFNLTATVEISKHFFAWLMRFGRGAILQSPEPVVKEFGSSRLLREKGEKGLQKEHR